MLQHGLYDICSDLVEEGAKQCCRDNFFQFHLGLKKCKIWPMEIRFQKASINELLSRLGDFEIELKDTCSKCRKSYKRLVELAVSNVKYLLQGLCLDCVRDSGRWAGSEDRDYWARHSKYDMGMATCRSKHGEPTWYWSFMGRPERRQIMMPKPARRDDDF